MHHCAIPRNEMNTIISSISLSFSFFFLRDIISLSTVFYVLYRKDHFDDANKHF